MVSKRLGDCKRGCNVGEGDSERTKSVLNEVRPCCQCLGASYHDLYAITFFVLLPCARLVCR